MPDLPEDVRSVQRHYRSGQAGLVVDFFSPCLRHCICYRRAAGYFSTHALLTWLDSLPRLIQGELREIRLLISPALSADDTTALRDCVDPTRRDELRQLLADRIVEDALRLLADPQDTNLRLKLFAWLVANDKLELRFAFPTHVANPGIYHEKLGIFDFPGGHQIAFTGSANETRGGHVGNYESVDVYRSWVEHETQRVRDKEAQFDEAWNGTAPGLEIRTLSRRVLDAVIESAPDEVPVLPTGGSAPINTDRNAAWKWRHQEAAVDAWFDAGGKGVLDMATGTGKTRTALKILDRLVADESSDRIIVTTDGTDLLDQWWQQLLAWQSTTGHPWRQFRHYGQHHELERFTNNPKTGILLVSRGQLRHVFRDLLPAERSSLTIIHDEVHALGSNENRTALLGEHGSCRYTLGLSATPERPYDDDGSQFIRDELGEVVFSFELEDAIERGILCEFDYVPIPYELTSDDQARLRQVYAREAAGKRAGTPMTREQVWIELSKVYKTAELKPAHFADYVQDHPDVLDSAIIFVETREYGESVLDILAQHTHRYRAYYAADDSSHLTSFARGEIDCLLTCHKLSQGIDIPHLKNVILFSSSRGRLETIQRIGRCLRTSISDPEKRARVVDFVLADGVADQGGSADGERHTWLSNLARTRKKDDHAPRP